MNFSHAAVANGILLANYTPAVLISAAPFVLILCYTFSLPHAAAHPHGRTLVSEDLHFTFNQNFG